VDIVDSIHGNFLRIPENILKEIKDYQVVIGFSGFGNVGYLSLTHMSEVLELETLAVWGSTSWFYKGRLESLLTVYKHKKSKTILVTSRVPIHVATIPQKYWDELTEEILLWNCKKYIYIAGLREDTRLKESSNWIVYAPTNRWVEYYEEYSTPKINDKLTMIGPLNSFLQIGTSFNKAVLGLLIYCNFEEDREATRLALDSLEKITGISISNKENILSFDYSFIPNNQNIIPNTLIEDEDNEEDADEDIPGYDFSDLI